MQSDSTFLKQILDFSYHAQHACEEGKLPSFSKDATKHMIETLMVQAHKP